MTSMNREEPTEVTVYGCDRFSAGSAEREMALHYDAERKSLAAKGDKAGAARAKSNADHYTRLAAAAWRER